MKNCSFINQSGMMIEIKTDRIPKACFGIYLTCESLGIKNGWATFKKKGNTNVLMVHAFATPDKKPYGFVLPKEVEENILADKLDACTMTGEIVVAKVFNEEGEIEFEKYCTAIAEPKFPNEEPWYKVTERLERYIRCQADCGRVYDMGGLEEEPCEVNCLYAGKDSPDKYQYIHTTDNSVFRALGTDVSDEKRTFTLLLKKVKLLDKDDDSAFDS